MGRPVDRTPVRARRDRPPAPVAGRSGHVMVATDDELIVWGGRNDALLADGAAWSFADQRWRTLAPSPLSPREHALAVWTGSEVLIVGGADGTRDAAAYDPATDTWRELPGLPFDASEELSSAAWTGSELVVAQIQGRANEFHPSDTYVLEPAADVTEDPVRLEVRTRFELVDLVVDVRVGGGQIEQPVVVEVAEGDAPAAAANRERAEPRDRSRVVERAAAVVAVEGKRLA